MRRSAPREGLPTSPAGDPATVPELTALRRAGAGKVALEVDGRPWRVVSEEVVVAAGLASGLRLDDAALGRICAEEARSRGWAVAARALARRDLSRRRLAERLERARVPAATVGEVVRSLERAGIVDDARVAEARAGGLAERGWGDAAVRARLEGEGVSEADARAAVAALAPERERAARAVADERDPWRAARLLARRGFDPDTVDEILAGLDWDGPAG